MNVFSLRLKFVIPPGVGHYSIGLSANSWNCFANGKVACMYGAYLDGASEPEEYSVNGPSMTFVGAGVAGQDVVHRSETTRERYKLSQGRV